MARGGAVAESRYKKVVRGSDSEASTSYLYALHKRRVRTVVTPPPLRRARLREILQHARCRIGLRQGSTTRRASTRRPFLLLRSSFIHFVTDLSQRGPRPTQTHSPGTHCHMQTFLTFVTVEIEIRLPFVFGLTAAML